MFKSWMLKCSLLFTLVLATSCQNATLLNLPASVPLLPETEVQMIAITEPVSQPDAQISGMAWYNDEWLVMLPQYPGFFTNDNDHGHIFALKKQDILDFLNDKRSTPIAPRVIAFVAPGIMSGVEGFDGYEAIAFAGDDAFLTIEARAGSGAKGYLVHAVMADDMSSLTIDTITPTPIDPQANLGNISDESIFVTNDSVVTLYEINGASLNPKPVAHRFGFDLQPLPTIPFTNVDYRITDATALDEQNRFWAVNYFYTGEPYFKPESDPLVQQYGLGATARRYEHVERLVEFQYSEQGITRIDQPPVYLRLNSIQHNWEGIVRLDNRGFLITTDEFPGTLLGFVARRQ